MNDVTTPQENASAADNIKIETHCHICNGELTEGRAIVNSKCGVNYHEECAEKVVGCPACGENLLERLLNEEAKEKMMMKDRVFTILIFVLPFVVIELLIGIWSMLNHPSWWSIPPWLGEAFALDLIILIVGILIPLAIFFWFGYEPERRTLNAIVFAQKGPTPGKAEEQLYTCGYGDLASPNELGDVSIPKKAGVQRNSIVNVMIDRLTKTPEGSFIWANPKFLKLLNPKKNPQPSGPEELERIWKVSGRTMILPEEGGEAETEEKNLCSTCGQTLEYNAEDDAWYCISCGSYKEELPPPDESAT